MANRASSTSLTTARSLTLAKAVVVVLAATMVVFMFERPGMYPLWTVVMIAAVGAFTLLSVYRDFFG